MLHTVTDFPQTPQDDWYLTHGPWHEMLSFSVRKVIVENSNSLVVISLSKVGENEVLQTI